MTARKAPDQCVTVNELDGHPSRELSRGLREGTGCDENAARGADLVHRSGELTNLWDTNLVDKPVLALHED
jgi:hypothetical protein